MDYFKDDSETTSMYRKFVMKYLEVLLIPLGIPLAVSVAIIATSIIFSPVFVAAFVEFGQYPWEYMFQPAESHVLNKLPIEWYIVFGLWVVFGITGLYAAGSTLIEEVFHD